MLDQSPPPNGEWWDPDPVQRQSERRPHPKAGLGSAGGSQRGGTHPTPGAPRTGYHGEAGVRAVARGAQPLKADGRCSEQSLGVRTGVGRLGEQSHPALPRHQPHAGWERSENNEPGTDTLQTTSGQKNRPQTLAQTPEPRKNSASGDSSAASPISVSGMKQGPRLADPTPLEAQASQLLRNSPDL